jgi:plasmid stabilization system protein ParE
MKEDIEYARRLYAQRAAPEGPRAAELFEQRLLAACDARADTPFGRDLAALVGARKKAGRISGTERQTGEATGTGAP